MSGLISGCFFLLCVVSGSRLPPHAVYVVFMVSVMFTAFGLHGWRLFGHGFHPLDENGLGFNMQNKWSKVKVVNFYSYVF